MPRRAALVLALLAGLLSAGAVPAAHADTTTARALLFKLTLAAEGGSTTYDRSYFRHWTDANGDCQNTRAEVLIAESRVTPTYTSGSRCTVASGPLVLLLRRTDLDQPQRRRRRPRRRAQGGLGVRRAQLDGDQPQPVANDLSYGRSLVAVTDNVNASKSDRDPAQWLPPRSAAHCRYATTWVLVKYRWRLSVDSAERSRLSSLLSGDCGAKTVTPSERCRREKPLLTAQHARSVQPGKATWGV